MITHVFNSSIVSGPETLVLPALTKLNPDVDVIFLEETRLARRDDDTLSPIDYARDMGLRVHQIRVRSRWDRAAFRELGRVFAELRPDVIHAHDVKASVYALHGAKLAKSSALRISTHHGAAARPGLKLRLYEEYYVRKILPQYQRVCCVCRQDLGSLESRGLSKEQIRFHPNGVDRRETSPEARAHERARIRELWQSTLSLPTDPNAIFIGAVARLSSEKRHDLMLRSFHEALRFWSGPPIRLLCFGVGPERDRLLALSRELGLEEHVRWMGYRPSIGNEMAGLDLMLLLSSGEGLPISILEAGWAGTPVFSTAVGEISEVLEAGQNGWLVAADSRPHAIGRELASVCSDRSGLIARGARLQGRVKENYSQGAWLKRLREIYAQSL